MNLLATDGTHELVFIRTQQDIIVVNISATRAYTALFPCHIAKTRREKIAPDEKTARHAPT